MSYCIFGSKDLETINSIFQGAFLLGLKIETLEGLKHCEPILSVPGIGFAEMGPGDMSKSWRGTED